VTIRTPSLALLSIALLAAGCKKEQPVTPGEFHRYPIEHIHVHYIYSGLGRGTEDLYFDQYGRRETKYVNWEHIEEKALRPMIRLTISVGPDIYTCLLDRGEGTHWKDPQLDSLFHLSAANIPSPEKITQTILSEKGKLVGQDTVLGLKADIWKITGTPLELYIWKGVLLKRASVAAGDTVVVTAVSIDTVRRPNESAFVVPGGIKMRERPLPSAPLGQ